MRQKRRKTYKILKILFAADLVCLITTVIIGQKAYAGFTSKTEDIEPNSKYNHEIIETFATDVYNQAVTSSLTYKLDYINSHPEIYGEKLVELANRTDEVVDYVYNYPNEYGVVYSDNLEGEIDTNTVPLLYQWDKRWGYTDYSGGLMGYTGCGPTSLSMVAIYLTKNTSYTPLAVAKYATEAGYSCDGSGSYWSLMSDGCEHFGIHSKELPLNENLMIEELQKGHPIICIMGPGEFTTVGHFIVVTDYVDGKFKINDCFSPSRSEKLWDYDEFYDQIQNLWAFYID